MSVRIWRVNNVVLKLFYYLFTFPVSTVQKRDLSDFALIKGRHIKVSMQVINTLLLAYRKSVHFSAS